jgi:hypothetical protein
MRSDLNHFTRPTRPPAVGDIARQLRELPSEAAPPYDFAEFRRRSRERSAPRRQLVTWPYAAAAAGLTAFVAAMALLGTGPGANDDVVGPATAAVAPGPTGSATDTRDPHGASAAALVASNGSAAPRGNSGGAAPSNDSVAAPGGSGGAAPSNGSSAAPGVSDGASRATLGAEVAGGKAVAPVLAAGSNDDPSAQARAAREWLARQPAEPAVVRAGPRLVVASLEDRIAWFDDALTDQRLHGATPAQLKLLQQERARLVSSLAQVRFAEALVADGS